MSGFESLVSEADGNCLGGLWLFCIVSYYAQRLELYDVLICAIVLASISVLLKAEVEASDSEKSG